MCDVIWLEKNKNYLFLEGNEYIDAMGRYIYIIISCKNNKLYLSCEDTTSNNDLNLTNGRFLYKDNLIMQLSTSFLKPTPNTIKKIYLVKREKKLKRITN